ncbi:hypothetical protein O3Q52_11075 [Streptomyces sp. ActVer]|uniref:hypothetical protein n=1 Tax=Streptomyces sp. ActVer TaxID=3014558 RepID=UPI0022B54DE6|nr:hypothetical protein [Streptomyces sp. ActVer]MCZ4508736.1 hypothetical protein [Streptomyces sp. ActVer]
MAATDVKRARRWFWALTATAILATGRLYYGLQSAPGPATGILVLGSSLMLAASVVQAARILAALTAPPRLRLLPRRAAGGQSAAGSHHRRSARRLSRSHPSKEG